MWMLSGFLAIQWCCDNCIAVCMELMPWEAYEDIHRCLHFADDWEGWDDAHYNNDQLTVEEGMERHRCMHGSLEEVHCRR